MNYLVIKNESMLKSYLLTSTCNKPRIKISDSYIPITNKKKTGTYIRCSGSYLAENVSTVTYGLEYTSTTNTIYETRVSTSNSVYLTERKTSGRRGGTLISTTYYTGTNSEYTSVDKSYVKTGTFTASDRAMWCEIYSALTRSGSYRTFVNKFSYYNVITATYAQTTGTSYYTRVSTSNTRYETTTSKDSYITSYFE